MAQELSSMRLTTYNEILPHPTLSPMKFTTTLVHRQTQSPRVLYSLLIYTSSLYVSGKTAALLYALETPTTEEILLLLLLRVCTLSGQPDDSPRQRLLDSSPVRVCSNCSSSVRDLPNLSGSRQMLESRDLSPAASCLSWAIQSCRRGYSHAWLAELRRTPYACWTSNP